MEVELPFAELKGKYVQLEFLPTPQSRKWRKGFIAISYSEIAYNNAVKIKQLNGYHAIRFVPFGKSHDH